MSDAKPNYTETNDRSLKIDQGFLLPNWDQRGIMKGGYTIEADFSQASQYIDTDLQNLLSGTQTRMTLSQIYPGGLYQFSNGSEGQPSISAVTDVETGIFWPATDQLGISVNGTLEATFNASGLQVHNCDQTGVIYAGALGQLTTDVTKFVYLESTDRLGVGTNTPGATIDAFNGSSTQLRLSYSAANYSTLSTDSFGGLIITSIGREVSFEQSSDDFITLGVENLSSNVFAYATLSATVPAGAGDPFTYYLVRGGETWSVGIDNSDSDKFKISNNTTLGNTDRLNITPTGELVINATDSDRDTRIEGVGSTHLLFVDASTAYVGINTSGPDRRLDVLDATNPQLRLTHTDGVDFTDFQVDTNGDMTITPSGGDVIISGTLSASSFTVSGLSATRVLFAGTGGLISDDSGFTFAAASDSVALAGYMNVGTATDADAAGEFACGITSSGRMHFQRRYAGDGLVNDGAGDVLNSGWLRIVGSNANEFLDLTTYSFGHTIHARNADGVIEFHIWNNTSMANYGACFSLTATNTLNQAETRNVGDTDGLAVRWDSTGPSLLTTAATATFIDFGLNATRYHRMTASAIQPITDAAADLGLGGGTPKRWNNLYLAAQGLGSDGAAGTPSWSFNSEGTMGFYRRQSGETTWSVGSTGQIGIQSDNIYMRSSYALNWLSGALGTSIDSYIKRRASGALTFGISSTNYMELQAANLYMTTDMALNWVAAAGIGAGSVEATISNSSGSLKIETTVTGGVVINDNGNDRDTRIEGDNKTSNFLLDASDDEVAIDGRFSLLASTPAQITSDQNDYAGAEGTATSRSTVWRISSDAARNITGIANGLDGRKLILINVGAQNIVIQNQNAGSTAANRVITGTGADVTMAADDTMTLWYDSSTSRWRVLNTH